MNQPETPAVILSHERSGSHLLGDSIVSLHNVTVIDEVCNPNAVDPLTKEHSFPGFQYRHALAHPEQFLKSTFAARVQFVRSDFDHLPAAASLLQRESAWIGSHVAKRMRWHDLAYEEGPVFTFGAEPLRIRLPVRTGSGSENRGARHPEQLGVRGALDRRPEWKERAAEQRRPSGRQRARWRGSLPGGAQPGEQQHRRRAGGQDRRQRDEQ